MKLGDKVHVVLEVTGEVVGRTYEQDPKVDLKLPWGMLNGVPLSMLEESERRATAEAATNVTEIHRAVRKRKNAIGAAG